MATASRPKQEPFFVGYMNKLPKGMPVFLSMAFGGFVALMGMLAFSISATIDDPGNGRFVWQRVEMTGILSLDPYPVVYTRNQDTGETEAILMSGQGKRGPGVGRDLQEGAMVTIGGVLLKRGTIDMMQLAGGPNGLAERIQDGQTSVDDLEIPKPENLGIWQLTGEICDGKCYQGAMRPGRGLSHKACANLCLAGGIPAVFVSTSPVDGDVFFLLADKDGKAPPPEIYDLTALYVTMKGEVERRGNLLVFKADFNSAEVL